MREIVNSRLLRGERLSFEEALWCLTEANMWELGRWAHHVRLRIHPPERVTYQVDRNINYSNVCISQCKFCAFYRPPGHPEGWTLTIEEILDKVVETVQNGGTGILLQGGHNPDIPFKYYEDLLRAIRAKFPFIHIHAFSPPEISAFSRFYSMTPERILRRLIDAGLDSLPGGGAEILSDSVRKKVSPGKCSSREWLDIMRTAHKLGIKSTATMVIGLGEKPEDRLKHLLKIRDLQDETGGFTAFIPWSFQKSDWKLGKGRSSAVEYLRIQAVARLVLDNIPHHQVSWVTQGTQVGSLALFFGADDFSSVMMEERVVAAAGRYDLIDESEMRRIIEALGFKPVKRLTLYQNILHG